MTESKPWYQSRGVVGPLVAAVLAMLQGFGVSFGEGAAEHFTNVIIQVGIAAGALVGIWGRVKADKRIGG